MPFQLSLTNVSLSTRVATSAMWKNVTGRDEAPKALQLRRRRRQGGWGNGHPTRESGGVS